LERSIEGPIHTNSIFISTCSVNPQSPLRLERAKIYSLSISFLVREARVDDLRSILEIYNDAVLSSTSTFDIDPVTIEARKIWFDEHDMHYPLIVADASRVVAGYCSISAYSKKHGYSKTVEMSVYVRENFRRQCIGSALTKNMIARARRLGYHAIISSVSDSNVISKRLYKNLGFEFRGHLKQVGYKFGKWQDLALFELLI
jgi:L-amino acid N-acyltransferase YncA